MSKLALTRFESTGEPVVPGVAQISYFSDAMSWLRNALLAPLGLT
jgi:hypothetical protein